MRLFRFGIIDIPPGEMIANPFSPTHCLPTPRRSATLLRNPPSGSAWKILALTVGMISALAAEQFGNFTYIVVDTGGVQTITITDYPTTATGLVAIPAEIVTKPVTSIGFEAFADCVGITEVTIPASVTSIESRAFFRCEAMTSVTIPVGVTSIGSSAFSNCRKLLSANIPVGVTLIGDGLFQDCVALATITLPEGIISIGQNAFSNCAALTGVTIPSTVKTINSSAFIFCSSLTSIVIPEGVTSIGTSCFADCSNLASVTLPASLTTPLTSLGAAAFKNCAKLASVAIPSGVTSIGISTFDGCTALSSVTIPTSVTSIGSSAFKTCTSLQSINIPKSVLTIGATDVFSSCSALTSISVDDNNPNFSSSLEGVLFNKLKTNLVTYPRGRAGSYTIPSSVTTLGANSFRYAVGVTSLSIHAGVTSIGSEAIIGCSALISISVDGSNPNYSSSLDGVLFNKLKTTLLSYPSGLSGAYTVPSGVATISASSFRSNAGLTAVTIPTSVTSIGSNAFASCSLLAGATFIGDGLMGNSTVFSGAASGFKVYYYPGKTGFTPNWNGFPTVELGPVVTWLTSHGLSAGSDLGSDANHDGVSLLMAYALGLDPNLNLSASIPQPLFTPTEMRMSFRAGAAGVTYQVQTCTNFSDWTTAGVQLPAPDAQQMQTATVLRNGPTRFMRLVVSQ